MLKDAEHFFKIFSDQNRLRILNLLRQRTMCVCEISFVLRVTQPSISRHLRLMKEVGLIGDEQDGLWTNYFLKKNSAVGEHIFSYVESFLKDDKIIKTDMQRLKKADRKNLCSGKD